MHTFFDNSPSWKQIMRMYNAAAVSLALYDLVTNPEAQLTEFGLELIIHSYNYYCLGENSGVLNHLFGAGTNFFGMGAIYSGVTSGCSGAPLAMNALKASGYFLNAGTLILSDDCDSDENNQEHQSKPH